MGMSWGEFTAQPNGKRIYNHDFDECVAVANQYNEEVLGNAFVPVGSAYQWWTDFARYQQLRNVYVQSQTAVPGAIPIWRGGRYNSRDGHIGVVTSVNGDGSTYNTMEQNAEANRFLWRYTRDRANLLGFLIPMNNPATVDEESGMKLAWDTNGKGYLVTSDGFAHLPDMEHWTLFSRLLQSTPAAPDRFNPREMGLMNKVLEDLSKRNASGAVADVDYGKIAKTVNDEASRRLQG